MTKRPHDTENFSSDLLEKMRIKRFKSDTSTTEPLIHSTEKSSNTDSVLRDLHESVNYLHRKMNAQKKIIQASRLNDYENTRTKESKHSQSSNSMVFNPGYSLSTLGSLLKQVSVPVALLLLDQIRKRFMGVKNIPSIPKTSITNDSPSPPNDTSFSIYRD